MCQILATIAGTKLRILNCHMNTESADFLGGLRPFRGQEGADGKINKQHQLFEWADGPLIESMQEGTFFLADEISLAEDSVLERLNCLLEPERTLLLAEKATSTDSVDGGGCEIIAKNGFQFMATMNPGGDYGKKELSPALRNRFTEIWCRPEERRDDLILIAVQSLRRDSNDVATSDKLAEVVVDVSLFIKKIVEKFTISVRDVLAWCDYLTKNADIKSALMLGLNTIYLDSFEMLSFEQNEIINFKKEIENFAQAQVLRLGLSSGVVAPVEKMSQSVKYAAETFGISPFFIATKANNVTVDSENFTFSAPTTCENLFRILSALTLGKAILLEGSPGVGKTSIVESLAHVVGCKIVRINLCEQTDLADLFGTDLPNEDVQDGSFIWRDGPLLSCLKAKDTWILLDELNLAPQSVLEGLNAVLDHRGEVFVPELNKKFKLGDKTRIFATQNPLKQGGGRKGLPQSFLNRFTKVYLKKLEHNDLHQIVRASKQFQNCASVFTQFPFDVIEKMIQFSEQLDTCLAKLECGYKGGPFEANLRDLLRWLEFFAQSSKDCQSAEESIEILFEKMKLVYVERMRTDHDHQFIVGLFSAVFEVNGSKLLEKANDFGVFWTDSQLFINDLTVDRLEYEFSQQNLKPTLLLDNQYGAIKNLIECAQMQKPVIVSGPSNCGKTKLIDAFAAIKDVNLVVDIIEDSVTGNFQQVNT